MVQQKQGGRPPKARPKPESKPLAPVERHSGEGSASVLETLQKLEKRRLERVRHPGIDADAEDPSN